MVCGEERFDWEVLGWRFWRMDREAGVEIRGLSSAVFIYAKNEGEFDVGNAGQGLGKKKKYFLEWNVR